MPRRGILILSGAPRIVSSVSDLENPAAQAPPSVYLKTRPADRCPIKPPLAAIQRRRCGPIWPRHNGPVSAAANKFWRFRRYLGVWSMLAAYLELQFSIRIPLIGTLDTIPALRIRPIGPFEATALNIVLQWITT